MDSMITSSGKESSPKPAGFTLVEVMICAAIGSFVLAGVLSVFVFLVRSSTGLYNYVGMESEARRGLERFSEDTRMAKAITWTDNTRVALTVEHPNDSYSNTITYYWDTTTFDRVDPPTHPFIREEATTNSSGTSTGTTRTTLIHDVSSFQFDRWVRGSSSVQATSNAATDQLQIHLTLRKQSSQYGQQTSGVVAATNLVVSARYILRNKPL